jgi:hypothetical protein
MQQVYSSTHKASLAMVLSLIWQCWRLCVSSSMRLDDAGVGRWPLASVVAGNPRNQFVFIDHLRFYLQSFQNNHFILVCVFVFTYVASCNLIFN